MNNLKDINDNDDIKHYGMVAYHLKNTLSSNGTVSRGVCEIVDGYLSKVTERTKIGYNDGKLVYFEDDCVTTIDEDVLVSCNLFGFTKGIFLDGMKYFEEFLTSDKDLSKDEFYLPTIVQKSIDDKKAILKVLSTTSKFNGMTYREDLESLKENILQLVNEGVYPKNLWGEENEK